MSWTAAFTNTAASRRKAANFPNHLLVPMLFCTLLFGLFIISPSGHALAATTFHVSDSHPLASDNNPGTPEQPLKSISEGLIRAMPGDTILVAAGIYREKLNFPRSGESSARPITLKSLPSGQAVILGSAQVTGWSPAYDQIWVRYGWGVNSQQVFVNWQPLQQIGAAGPYHTAQAVGRSVLPATGAGLTDMFPGSFWYDQDMGALYVWLPDGSSPENHHMEASVRPHIVTPTPRAHIHLDGLVFGLSNAAAQVLETAMVHAWGEHWRVENSFFMYGDMSGLSLAGHNHTIANNVFLLNGSLGISIEAAEVLGSSGNLVLSNNETSYNNFRNFDFWWKAGGVKAMAGCADILFENHLALDNAGTGLWVDDQCRGVNVRESYFKANLAGAILNQSDSARIENSIFLQNTFALAGLSPTSSRIAHNTLHDNAYGALILDMGAPTRGNVLRNNLFSDHSDLDLGIFSPDFLSMDNVSDHNAYARAGNSVLVQWATQGQLQHTNSLETLQNVAGLDQNSMTSTALWPRISRSGAFSLVPPTNSPVVNAALYDAATPRQDFYGTSRPTGRGPDIGAVENPAVEPVQPADGDLVNVPARLPELETVADKPETSPPPQQPSSDGTTPVEGQETVSITVSWEDDQLPRPTGYYLYIGTKSRNYDRVIDVGNSLSATIGGIRKDQQYYISSAAYDASQNQSDFSNEILFKFPK